jgi:hypothetical protein
MAGRLHDRVCPFYLPGFVNTPTTELLGVGKEAQKREDSRRMRKFLQRRKIPERHLGKLCLAVQTGRILPFFRVTIGTTNAV